MGGRALCGVIYREETPIDGGGALTVATQRATAPRGDRGRGWEGAGDESRPPRGRRGPGG